jgi:hypothetical protein
VVDSKFYSLWGEWCSNEPLGSYGVGLWKNIRRGWGSFAGHTTFEVGDGAKVSFWHDLWYGDKALKEAFSDLFPIACAKDASEAAYLELFGSWRWMYSPRL